MNALGADVETLVEKRSDLEARAEEISKRIQAKKQAMIEVRKDMGATLRQQRKRKRAE